MQKILINSIPQETRIAVLENDQLYEIYIEGSKNKRLVGDVIKGRVTKVLPGMEAAFVDIGLDKDAFLYVMDVFDNLSEYEKLLFEHDGEEEGLTELEHQDTHRVHSTQSIEQLLREGQEILVQVAKEPLGTKGARVTSHLNLPGRYLVLMPTVSHIGVSRRIESESERKRLRKIAEDIRTHNHGVIIRTAGEGMETDDFVADYKALCNLWEKIQKRSERARTPSIIHQDFDPIYRAVRDFFTPDVEHILVDNEADYQRCVETLNALSPENVNRVKLFTKGSNVFDEYNVEEELEKALDRKVWLKSGGYIVVEQTEALIAIDVNTGKYVGNKNLESTITEINLEATKEIARQVRLRNLGGIIIIDFIDMEIENNKERVIHALEKAFKNDRARSHIYGFTELGMVEMTRKRVKRSLGRTMCQSCPYCKGDGMIKSLISISYDIYRHLQKILDDYSGNELLVRVHPDVASHLRREQRDYIEELEYAYRKTITIRGDENLHQEKYDIIAF